MNGNMKNRYWLSRSITVYDWSERRENENRKGCVKVNWVWNSIKGIWRPALQMSRQLKWVAFLDSGKYLWGNGSAFRSKNGKEGVAKSSNEMMKRRLHRITPYSAAPLIALRHISSGVQAFQSSQWRSWEPLRR